MSTARVESGCDDRPAASDNAEVNKYLILAIIAASFTD
jgi:hypothetical protein